VTSYWFLRWQPRRLKTTSGFIFDDVTLFRRSTSIHKPNIIDIYFNPRMGYNYFRFRKTTVCHIGILLPVSILTTSPYSACHSALDCRVSSKSVHPLRRYDVMSIFKMAAAAAQFYFRFWIWWRRSLQNVRIHQKIKFRSYISIHSWDIIISRL